MTLTVIFHLLRMLSITGAFRGLKNDKMGQKKIKIDYSSYRKFVEDVVNDENLFSVFKQHPEYSVIVGTIGVDFGKQYLEYIQVNYPELLSYLSKFADGDKIGSPFLHEFEGVLMDPLSLRYIKILGDLLKYFGTLNGKHIVEIGCGFGGQCKVIYDYCTPASYTIVDTPEVLKLTQSYLSYFDIHPLSRNTDDVSDIQYDLCISNYAFSEFTRNFQEFYTQHILQYSSEGYMILNFLNPHPRELRYTFEEYLSLKQTISLKKEVPKTAFDNALCIWTNTNHK